MTVTSEHQILKNLHSIQDRQHTRKCDTEMDSSNHCCHGKAMTITYSEYVFVALGNQHAMGIDHIVICGLSGSTIFFHIIS